MTKLNKDPLSLSPDPLSLSPEQRLEIARRMATCPFVGTAVATGQLQVFHTADNPLADVEEVARLGDSGGGDLGSRVLKLFARGNHSRWVVPEQGAGEFVPAGMFSLHFGGSQGAHAGHSGILLRDPGAIGGGALDEERFKQLEGYADSDGRLSIDSVGDFIAENLENSEPKANVLPWLRLIRDTAGMLNEFKDLLLRRDETEKTELISALTKLLGEDHLVASAGEWGLLFAFLKNSPRSNDGDIALADVKEMFVDKRFPAGWETWEKSALSWVKATLLLTKDAGFAFHFGWK